jgi:hypothetical protein
MNLKTAPKNEKPFARHKTANGGGKLECLNIKLTKDGCFYYSISATLYAFLDRNRIFYIILYNKYLYSRGYGECSMLNCLCPGRGL